jgi:hypothetical protein
MGRRRFLFAMALAGVGAVVNAEPVGVPVIQAVPLLNRVQFGAYAAPEPWPDVTPHYALESQLGVRLPTMSWFLGFDGGWPAAQAAAAAQTGHDLLLAWQPAHRDGSPIYYQEILDGTYDTRMVKFFQAAKDFPGQVTIRFAHEMNLGQLVQSVANKNPCTGDLNVWLDTWRALVDTQRSIGGDNVKWQWCVNSLDINGPAAESYWPGGDYVDSIGIDAYNGYGPWTGPSALIKPMYDRVCKLHPTAEIWLTEVGCRAVTTGETVSKASWWRQLFNTTAFPRITKIVFFNANKERDWRIDTSDVASIMSAQLQTNAKALQQAAEQAGSTQQ